MNHFSFELSIIAVLPALILCGYIFYKDRIEREPVGLLLILFLSGFAAYIPSFFIQKHSTSLIDLIFKSKIEITAEGAVNYASPSTEILHLSLCAVFGYSLISILIRWLVLFLITRKNKNFNYLFDGVVYSVFISLGFAVCENLHFIMQNDTDMSIEKLITSVPCHLFIGVLMGYYYTMWHMRFTANAIENNLLKAGVIEKDNIRSSAVWLIGSLFIPLAVNSVYILAGKIKYDVASFVFYLAIFILFGISFITINGIALKDASYGRFLYRIIAKGHPVLSAEQIKEAIEAEEKEAE